MKQLSQSIAEIAQVVFPVAQRRSKESGETITFNVEVSDGEGEGHQSYIMTVWDDCLVQTRISSDDGKSVILGRRGRRAIEMNVGSADMDVVYDHIEAVTAQLIKD